MHSTSETRTPDKNAGLNIPSELNRIFSSAILACLLLVLFAFLEPPITVLSWLLFGAGLLSLGYIAAASYALTRTMKSMEKDGHLE